MSLHLAFGGTFDPVHAGHLAVARAVRDTFHADVRLLPAADPPHRGATAASAAQRARMLELALAGETGLAMDPRELARDGPSYTVDSLRELRAEWGPDAALAWVVGVDAFRGLPTWREWTALLDLAHLVVVVRPGYGLDDLSPALAAAVAGRWQDRPGALAEARAGRLYRLEMAPHPASATELRRRLAAGEPTGDWLAPAVAGFIAREGLYRAGPGPAGV